MENNRVSFPNLVTAIEIKRRQFVGHRLIKIHKILRSISRAASTVSSLGCYNRTTSIL